VSTDQGRRVPFSRVHEDPLAVCEDGDWFCRDCEACLCRKCGHDVGCSQWAETTCFGLTFCYDPNDPPSGTWEWRGGRWEQA
jgi:hypothetical protein